MAMDAVFRRSNGFVLLWCMFILVCHLLPVLKCLKLPCVFPVSFMFGMILFFRQCGVLGNCFYSVCNALYVDYFTQS